MAARKRFRLTLLAAAPDRTDGVDDVARRRTSRGSCDCLSRGKTADATDNLPASIEDRRPSCTMNGAIHTAAAEQGRVGCVHDGVGPLASYVARAEDHQIAIAH